MEYSTTQSTNLLAIAGLIVLVAGKFGLVLGTEEVSFLIGAVVTIWGVVSNWIHRYKKGDLTLGGFKKY